MSADRVLGVGAKPEDPEGLALDPEGPAEDDSVAEGWGVEPESELAPEPDPAPTS